MNQFSIKTLQPWETEIVNKYPLIFLEPDCFVLRYVQKSDDYVNLRFGFEHDEGWSALIINLASVATGLVEFLRKSGHPDAFIHSLICKEKLGLLTWQGMFNLPPPFSDLWVSHVMRIENKSGYTCEVTGKYGQIGSNKSGWRKTLCEDEAVERGFSWDCWESN